MEKQSNCTPCSAKEEAVLDVKPLRTLSPMFPAPLGFNTFSPPGKSPFVCVTPFDSFPSSFESGSFPPFATPVTPNRQPVDPSRKHTTNGPAHANSNGSLYPPSFSFFHSPAMGIVNIDDEEEQPLASCLTSASGRKIKQRIGGSGTGGSDGSKMKQQRKRPRKVYNADLALLPSSSHDPRESVQVILMTFDALRRRLLQLDEGKDANRRPDLKAGAIMMGSDLRANMGKRIGPLPGIEVGDIFYFRMELCLVGLHAPSMGGIDYMTAKFDNGDDPVAISIVSAGGYENEEDDVDVLVYSGQGGNSTGKQMDDQKLERGNLALERSLHRGNEIRVVRSAKDFSCLNGKIYIYDGLYKIQESWVEKGKSGFNVFKYKLLREPEQPDGIAIWKMTQRWKENPASRGRVILPDISSGIENIPVCLVNEVDDEKGPSHFTYVTKVKYSRPFSSMKPLEGCKCLSVCLPGDASCACSQQNGGDLPYSSSGFLVSRKPIIYECSASCHCTINCRNRVTQKGIRLHFEVFRTRDRGWGLRSWDPIRAGTSICEYTGEVVDRINDDGDGEEDEYIFQTTQADEKFKWNYGPELLGEPSADDLSETFKPLPIIISAKNMGNVSRFMNHSCSPNVFWQLVQRDHSNEGYPHIMFFAIRHIPPMTELTYDYGLSGTEYNKEMGTGGQARRVKKCLCGSPKCRGLFG